MSPTVGPIVAHVWLQLSHSNGLVTMVTKLYPPRLTGASFASTSEVWTSAILVWLKLRDWKSWHRGHHQWHDLHTEFYENLPVRPRVISGDTRTDTDWWCHKTLAFILFSFVESRPNRQLSLPLTQNLQYICFHLWSINLIRYLLLSLNWMFVLPCSA
jgi:hypothetical protein